MAQRIAQSTSANPTSPSSTSTKPTSTNSTSTRHRFAYSRLQNSHPKLSAALSIIAIIIWTVGCLLLVQLLLSLIFRFLISNFGLRGTAVQTVYTTLSSVIAAAVIILVPAAVSKKFKNNSPPAANVAASKSQKSSTMKSLRTELGLIGWPTWTDLGLAFVGFVVHIILAAVANWAFSAFPWYDANQAQDLGYNQFMFGADRALAFFALVIIAPIAEELIFRGFLYNKIKTIILKYFKKSTPADKSITANKAASKITTKSTKPARRAEMVAIIVASLLVSLVFGVMHGQWNVGVNVFIMSLILCAMREITGSVYAGIIMHMLKNAVAFIMLFVLSFNF